MDTAEWWCFPWEEYYEDSEEANSEVKEISGEHFLLAMELEMDLLASNPLKRSQSGSLYEEMKAAEGDGCAERGGVVAGMHSMPS